jgi:uncharacterized protein (TIGR00369 family)
MASDPADTSLSGLDRIRAIRDGDAPQAPMALTLGFELERVEEGDASFLGEPSEKHLNPLGTIHGGLALTMLDSAMGVAVHTTLDSGQSYGTLETKVNLVRPITLETGTVRAEGRIVHRGSRIATAEGRLLAVEGGKLLAHGTSTCMILGG